MDRHVRNTFLLDYTLTQMKVLEPETSVFSSKTHPRLHQEEDGHPRNASPKENGSTNNSLSDNNIKVPTALASEVSEPASLKKRKSSKSKKKQRCDSNQRIAADKFKFYFVVELKLYLSCGNVQLSICFLAKILSVLGSQVVLRFESSACLVYCQQCAKSYLKNSTESFFFINNVIKPWF